MDQLEKFIVEHREDFDDVTPDLKVWGAIHQALEQKQAGLFVASTQTLGNAKRVSLWSYARYAAAATLLIGVGALGMVLFKQNPASIASHIVPSKSVALKDISPEYSEVQQYYVRKIAQQTQEFNTQKYDAGVNNDLQQIDQVTAELEAEMVNAPKGSREKIIATMINNYKTKMEILEKVLNNR
ncbi:MAG: hypothetical protein RLZZ292_3768 [Bacteroidota bacterium]|jgi:hypothetical protein